MTTAETNAPATSAPTTQQANAAAGNGADGSVRTAQDRMRDIDFLLG
jgi:hypothetical protein